VPKETPSLGVSLQWQALSTTEDVWHIMDVAPNSPADLAGLLPYGDYVIGSSEVIVRGESGLPELIEDVSTRAIFFPFLRPLYQSRDHCMHFVTRFAYNGNLKWCWKYSL
jgi:hypothetical protein